MNKNLQPNYNTQPNYNAQPNYNTYQPQEFDRPSVGLNFLSFLFPIVGFILYLSYMQRTPIKAKGCGKWALISFCLSIAMSIVSYILEIFYLMY